MQRSTIIICSLALLLAGVGTFAVNYGLGQVDSMRMDSAKQKKKIDQLHDRSNQASGLIRLDRNLSEVVDAASARALDATDEGIVAFLAEIEGDARSVGVKVDANSPDVPQDHSRVRMHIAVTGGWENIHRFIGIIEHLPYLIDVGSVSVGTSDLAFAPIPRTYHAQIDFTVLSVNYTTQ